MNWDDFGLFLSIAASNFPLWGVTVVIVGAVILSAVLRLLAIVRDWGD